MPIAAASLGQVYRCTLVSNGGASREDVAVKVQRPDMLRGCSLDFFLMRCYAKAIEEIKEVAVQAGLAAPRKRFDVELVEAFVAASCVFTTVLVTSGTLLRNMQLTIVYELDCYHL